MNDDQKRTYVSNLYNGTKWKRRVEKMRMDMVTAIYLKHQMDGSKPKHEEEPSQGLLDISTESLGPRHGPHDHEDEFPIV